MACGPTCACAGTEVECLSVVDPVRHGYFGAWCRLDESSELNRRRRQAVLGRSRIAAGAAPAPALPGELAAPPQPRPVQGIPLAGDLVAGLTALIGADRAAKWVAAKLGRDCGCAERRARLNGLDAAVRRFLSRPRS